MAIAGNSGSTQAADKAAKKAKTLKKKQAAAKAPGPPNFPKAIPVRPGAQTNRYKSTPSTQAQRTHVHKERVKRNKELKKSAATKDTKGAVDLTRGTHKPVPVDVTKGLKGDLAKKYAKDNPVLFAEKDKKKLVKAGFTPDVGVKLSTNAYKDLLQLGQTPVSTYHLAEPTVSAAAHGDFKKAGKEALKAGKASVEPIIETAKHPRREFMKHPVFTGLMVAGAEGAIGRSLGRAGRAGVAGKAGKRVASTERVTKTVPGTTLKETQKYSPDVIRKGVQVGREKYKGAKAYRKEKMQGIERVPETRMSEQEIKRRVDERIALNEDIRRQNREKMVQETHKALKGQKHPVTSLIAQGIVKPNKADIKAYIQHLEDVHPDLKPAAKHANKKLRKELQDAVDNPKLNLSAAEAAGKKYEKAVTQHERALIDAGLLTKEQALRARLMPYAVRHMGAEHNGESLVIPDKTPEVKHSLGFSPKSRPFKALDAKTGKKETFHAPGRGIMTSDGKLHTVFEEDATHADLKGAAGLPKYRRPDLGKETIDIHIRPDGKFEISDSPVGMSDMEAAARIERADPRLKWNKGKISPEVRAAVTPKANMRTLTTNEILAHYKANHSEDLPAFVTHRPRSSSSWNVRSEYAPSLGTGRTGRSVAHGTIDPSHDAMVASAVRVQGIKDAAEGFKGIVDEFGVKNDKGLVTFTTRKDAVAKARDMRFDEHSDPLPEGHDMVPIRVNPLAGSKHQLETLINDTKGDELWGAHSPVNDAIRQALEGTEGDGPWALVPEAAAKRIQEHMSTMGRTTFEQAAQATSGLFRKTVLSTSPTWLFGNVAEAGLRSAISGSGPLSYRRGRAVLKAIEKNDPVLAQEIAHRVAGGGHFSTAVRQQVFRSAEQFAGSSVEKPAKAMAQVARAPGARNIAHAWHAYSSYVFKFNSMLERQFQTAMFGKALKKEGYKAVEDAVNGLRGTESQVRFGRMVDDMYGKYSKWSPSTRHVIATYTPFISWWLNAVKFVAYTMPKDHPVATGLLASANVATEKWRRENKIELDQVGIKGGFLSGTLPGKGGTHINIARYTPWGATTNPLEVANTVLPQVGAIAAVARGEDWKGHEYKSTGEGLSGFGTEIAGAYIPGFQRQQQIKKYGAVQSVNPYRPIKPGKKKTSGGKPKQFDFKGESGGGFDWGGGSSSGTFDWSQ